MLQVNTAVPETMSSRDELRQLIWAGKYWGKDGALALHKRIYELHHRCPFELSSLSSTYYSASGSAWASAKIASNPFRKAMWILRSVICLCKAGIISGRYENQVGRSFMTADELDIRATILRRWRFYGEATSCLNEALNIKGLPIDTRARIYTGLAEIHMAAGRKDIAKDSYVYAMCDYESLEPTTKVRVMKSIGISYLSFDADFARAKLKDAIEIARQNGLTDQVMKIRAICGGEL